MNAAVDETSDKLDQPRASGPGERLKAARLAAGMEVERVASQLHLKAEQVLSLEEDDYQGFAARVFVRGYLRNYARLVSLPVDNVLAMFDAVWPESGDPLELKPVGTHKPQVSSRHGVVRTVSWALLAAIVALFFVWWSGYLKLNDSLPQPADLQGEAPPAEAAPPGTLALPGTPAGSNEADPVTPPAPDSGLAEDTVAVPEVEAPAAEAAAAPAQDGAAAGEAGAEAAATAPTPAPEASSAPLRPEVVLTLNGTCWVNIRDSSGSYKLIGQFKAGTHRVLEGTPPYRILLGNASVATLTVNGEPYDLAPHTNALVARFTLDTGAQ